MIFIVSPMRWIIPIICGETHKTEPGGVWGIMLWGVSCFLFFQSASLYLSYFGFPFSHDYPLFSSISSYSLHLQTQFTSIHKAIVKELYLFVITPKWGCLTVLVFKGCMISSFDDLLVKLEISWQRYLTPLGAFFMD